MEGQPKEGVLAHWKCLAACTLVSMCPFQYGIDFGIIGGLQAMKGFLEVSVELIQNPEFILTVRRSLVKKHPGPHWDGISHQAVNN